VPKIGAVLIGLILLGVAVIAVASVAVLRKRQAGNGRKVPDAYPAGGEKEVYERLYGKRSTTVSVVSVPNVELPREADVDSPPADPRE